MPDVFDTIQEAPKAKGDIFDNVSTPVEPGISSQEMAVQARDDFKKATDLNQPLGAFPPRWTQAQVDDAPTYYGVNVTRAKPPEHPTEAEHASSLGLVERYIQQFYNYGVASVANTVTKLSKQMHAFNAPIKREPVLGFDTGVSQDQALAELRGMKDWTALQRIQNSPEGWSVPVPFAKSFTEKLVDAGAGLHAFATQLMTAQAALKGAGFVSKSPMVNDMLAWEATGQANGQKPGHGTAMFIGLALTGYAPNKAVSLAMQSGGFGGLTYLQTGDPEAAAIQAAIPVAMAGLHINPGMWSKFSPEQRIQFANEALRRTIPQERLASVVNLAKQLPQAVETPAAAIEAKEAATPVSTPGQPQTQATGAAVKPETAEGPITKPQEVVEPIDTEATRVTGIKNAIVDQERAGRGLPPMLTSPEVTNDATWQRAMKEVELDPEKPARVARELAENPRPATLDEEAMLFHRAVTLNNDFEKAAQDQIDAQGRGDEVAVAEARGRLAKLSDDLQQLDTARKTSGEEWGRTGQFRQRLMAEDYSLAAMETKTRAANDGRPLTDAQRAEIKDLHDRIAATQKAHDDYVAQTEVRLRQLEIDRQIADVSAPKAEQPAPKTKGYGSRNKLVTTEDYEKTKAAFLKRQRGQLSAGIDPKYLADLAKMGAYHIEAGLRDFAAWSQTLINELGDSVKPYLDAAYKESLKQIGTEQQKAATAGLKAGIAQKRELPEMTRFIQKLSESFVQQGITEREPLIDAVHAVLKEIQPGISRRETMDAISGYGKYKRLDNDQIKSQLRDLKGQMQQVGKLQDMASKLPPKKTGVERRLPSDEERRLIQLVNEAKKKGGFQVTDPETQLKSALAAVKTRLRNSIADLEFQLASGKRIVKTKTAVPTDTEADALRAERDALKEDVDAMFGARQLTDAQRVSIAMKSVQRSITEYERRIAAGELEAPARESKTPETPELVAARARRDALKAELEHLQELANPKKSPEELALQAWKTRVSIRTAELEEKLADNDFSTKTRKTVQLDAHAQKLKAYNERVKQEYQGKLEQDRLSKRSRGEKMRDTYLKWYRNIWILSSPRVFAKLSSAAVARFATEPVMEMVGTGIAKVLPRLAKMAPRHGAGSIDAEAAVIAEVWSGSIRAMKSTVKTGSQDFDVLYGGKYKLPPEAVEFVGRLHGMMKAPVKLAEFTRSFHKRMAWEMRNGADGTDPVVQMRVGMAAAQDANASIFLQKNSLVEGYKRFMSSLEETSKVTGRKKPFAYTAATLIRLKLPIMTVPTNIVAEVLELGFGAVPGATKAAFAYARGIESLKPEEADLIMRLLKRGSVGLGVMALGIMAHDNVGGFWQRGEKRKKGEPMPGEVKVFGETIDKVWLHNPYMVTLDLGATAGRVATSKMSKADREAQGMSIGMVKALLGLTEEVPFIREAADTSKLFEGHPMDVIGANIEPLVVPQGVQYMAQKFDVDAQGKPIKREAHGITEQIKAATPGLRETLPKKKKK
jgi:hypothetical protein